MCYDSRTNIQVSFAELFMTLPALLTNPTGPTPSHIPSTPYLSAPLTYPSEAAATIHTPSTPLPACPPEASATSPTTSHTPIPHRIALPGPPDCLPP